MNLLTLLLRPSDWTRLWQTGNWKTHLMLFLTPLLGIIPMWVIFFIRLGAGDYISTSFTHLAVPFLVISLIFWLTSIPITLIHPMLATLLVMVIGTLTTAFTTFPFDDLVVASQPSLDLSPVFASNYQSLVLSAMLLIVLSIVGMIYALVLPNLINIKSTLSSALLSLIVFYAPFVLIFMLDYQQRQSLNIYLLAVIGFMGLWFYLYPSQRKRYLDELKDIPDELKDIYTKQREKTVNQFGNTIWIMLFAMLISMLASVHFFNLATNNLLLGIVLGVLGVIGLFVLSFFALAGIFLSLVPTPSTKPERLIQDSTWDVYVIYFSMLSMTVWSLPITWAYHNQPIVFSAILNFVVLSIMLLFVSSAYGGLLYSAMRHFVPKSVPLLISVVILPILALAVIFIIMTGYGLLTAVVSGLPPLRFFGLTNQPYLWMAQSPLTMLLFMITLSLTLTITRHNIVTNVIGGVVLWVFMPYNISASVFSLEVLLVFVLVYTAVLLAHFGVWLWLPLYRYTGSFRWFAFSKLGRNSGIVLTANNLPNRLLERTRRGWSSDMVQRGAKPDWFDNGRIREKVQKAHQERQWKLFREQISIARKVGHLPKALFQDDLSLTEHFSILARVDLSKYQVFFGDVVTKIEVIKQNNALLSRLNDAVALAQTLKKPEGMPRDLLDGFDLVKHTVPIVGGEFEDDLNTYYAVYDLLRHDNWSGLKKFKTPKLSKDAQTNITYFMDAIAAFREAMRHPTEDIRKKLKIQFNEFSSVEMSAMGEFIGILGAWDLITRIEVYDDMKADINALSQFITDWRRKQPASRPMFDKESFTLTTHSLPYQAMADFCLEQLTGLYQAIEDLKGASEVPLITLIESIQTISQLIDAGERLSAMSQRRVDGLLDTITRALIVVSNNVGRAQTIKSEIVRLQSIRASEEQIYQLRRKIRNDYPNERGDKWYDTLYPIQQLLHNSSSETTNRVGFSIPYVAGNSLDLEQQHLFKGREDVKNAILNKLASGGRPTILIHGPRRIGKSSFLKQLSHLLPPQYVPVFFDVTGGGATKSDGDFFYQMAYQIQFQLSYQRDLGLLNFKEDVILPDERLFKYDEQSSATMELNPASVLQRWLEQTIFPILGTGRFLYITIDEFEKIGEGIALGRLSLDILNDLRFMWQNMRQILLLFAGVQDIGALLPKEEDVSHEALKKRLRTFANPFVNTTAIALGFLDRVSAEKLVREPQPNMTHLPRYTDDAVIQILDITRCQPFLVQALCEKIVTLVNNEIEDGEEIEQIDVQWIAPAEQEVFNENRPYFDDLWKDVGQQGQNLFLDIIRNNTIGHYEDMSLIERLRDDWKFIEERDGGYQITIPLLEKWIRRKSPRI